ncbi:MAG TPA: adenylate/guanylate cyclase domain-containing protein, partial [Stellaceae bacterium]|nr:adenylate/guanylate cyclase domain-containing protein [Stellaceae bacterium]
VCTTNALVPRQGEHRLVSLAVIFQHSPAIILAPARTHISTLPELQGHTLMDAPGSDDIAAMLKSQGVDYARLPRVDHDGDPRGLISGDADAMVAYSTNETFVLERLGVPYRSFSPRAYGFDFYGDILCTSARQEAEHRERTRAFVAASLKGWAYALAHKEATVDLILKKYSGWKSREALLYEAARSESLIEADLVPLGSQTVTRWENIAATYRDLGMLDGEGLPKDFVYGASGIERWAKLRPVLLAAAVFALLTVPAWFLFRWLERHLARSLRKPKLSLIMAALFVGLSLPVLTFILYFNYERNSEAIIDTLRAQVAKTRLENVEALEGVIQSVAGTLRLISQVAAADPGFFTRASSNGALYQALNSGPEIDAAYVGYEDGSYRVVTRISDQRRRNDMTIPAAANWHSSWIDPFAAGDKRLRHRIFYDTWENEIGSEDVPTDLDPRSLPGYAQAKESNALAISGPSINPDTGYPVVSVRYPIVRDGLFIGCASVNITFDVLSRYLSTHRASPNSKSILTEPNSGEIIAGSERGMSVTAVDGKLEVARLDTIDDLDVRQAYQIHVQTGRDEFVFRSLPSGREIAASFTRFPNSFGRPREALILTPTDDFVGFLKETNRKVVEVILGLTVLELILIFFLSHRLSRPIESISSALKSVESLSFEETKVRPSAVREIDQLRHAIGLLRSSLRSVAAFVPLDLVRELVKSGIPLALGVEPRRLTVFFSDLENFSSLAERSKASELLTQMSHYFELFSRAIAEEHGTVDKFIGDGIMAFWGAPTPLPDHALRACRGALRATRRMEAANAGWRAEGRPTFRTRIGMHSAEVLVGNVGSPERFSYTAMGDGVNVASRLEGMNKLFGTALCISDSIAEALGPQILTRPMRRVRVKGREQAFMIYELLGIVGSTEPELAPRRRDERLAELTVAASARFEAGDLERAAEAYGALLREFPEDALATAMLAECRARERAAATES